MRIARTLDEGWWKVELKLEGETVSRATVFDLEMRIGRAVVRMAGVGGVWTHPEHRMKGLGVTQLPANSLSRNIYHRDGSPSKGGQWR